MSDVTLLDGGMGQELIARSANPAGALWSAEVMMREPHVVEAAHRAFVEAGARVITLNSYAATPERLARNGLESEFEALQERAIALAQAARDAARGERDVAIAACLSPLAGSYHPEKAPPADEMRAIYRRIAALQAPHVDVMLGETLSGVTEIEAATEAMAEQADGRPVWTAISVSDEDGTRLRSGEALTEGVAAAVASGATALLLNCSRPEAIERGLPAIEKTGLPWGAYANGFVRAADLELDGTVDDLGTREDLGPAAYADIAMKWVERGATIVGGCCEIGPDHIRMLAERLGAAGHGLVTPREGETT